MSTTSEITPAEPNPNDTASVNNPSQSQASTSHNQKPENNKTPEQDSIPETNVNPKQDSRTESSATSKQDPKAGNNKTRKHRRAFTWTTFEDFFSSKHKKFKVKQAAVKRIIHEKDVLSSLISADIDYINKTSEEQKRYNEKVNDRVAEAERRLEELKKEGDESTEKDYWELKKAVTKLKLQIPTKNKLNEKGQHHDQQSTGDLQAKQGQKIPAKVLDKFPELHGSDVLKNSRDFKDFKARYNDLSSEMKLCLLCFSVFPENAIIKKRLMVYWWIAEGFVPPIGETGEIENGKTPEEFGNEYFHELMKRGFIEPANKKRSMSVKSCRMNPLIRSALVMIAEKAKFFNFDAKGEPIENFAGSFRACLVGNGLLNYEDLRKGLIRVEDLEKLHLVFNVNEHILEFTTEWFLQMKNLNILYLGRWKVLATDHIEVEETEFLDGLKVMKYLQLFSLQGVSRITELPESVTKLSSLKILDVRACHNLETIPKEIGLLKNLTHLDMSECYLLEHMPKSLAMLLQLRVLKGFVVENEQRKNSCTLDDLVKLTKLEKLSIYTGLWEFPTQKHVTALQNLQSLRKLTIAWGGGALHVPEDQAEDKTDKTGAEQAKAQAKTQKKEASFVRSLLGKHLQGEDRKKDSAAAEQAKSQSEIQKTEASLSRPSHDKQEQAEDEKKANTAAEEAKAPPAKTQSTEAPPANPVIEKQKQVENKIKGNTAAEQSKAQAKTQKPQAPWGISNAFKKHSWKLEKLDLKCFPTAITPNWLTPSNLRGLKKLYIRGGKFSDLGQYQELLDGYKAADLPKENWDVQILRLKYLSELEMDWRELQELFPKLIYLEKVGCPKLTFFPCDATGVWINKEKLKKSDDKISIFSPSYSY